MEIKRDLYLNKLIRSMHNGMIKVVTGIRRCVKSPDCRTPRPQIYLTDFFAISDFLSTFAL